MYCDDCGCKMYGGLCTNCDEETFIADQYRELGESVPQALADTEETQKQRHIELKRGNS